MKAPGRYYVYQWGDGQRTTYEVKPDTYRISQDGRTRWVVEKVIRHEYASWCNNEALVAHVLGWYDTEAEALFAMEVLL